MQKLAILVTTCEKYNDVRKIHDQLFRKYWPQCPFPKYLVTDNLGDARENGLYDCVIEAGSAFGTRNTERILIALDRIEEPYVLLLQEDVFLCDMVDTNKILEIVNAAERYDAGLIRTGAGLMTDRVFEKDNNFLEFLKGSPYCIAFPGGLWNKQYLCRLLKQYDNCADVERWGSEQCKEYPEVILACRYAVYPFVDAVRKGYWEKVALALMNRNGIEPEGDRPVVDYKIELKFAILGYIFNLNTSGLLRLQKLFGFGKKY